VHRDKSGKEVSEEELRAAKDAEKKAKELVAPEWAGGIAQQRQAEARQAELAAQASQPFARRRCCCLNHPAVHLGSPFSGVLLSGCECHPAYKVVGFGS
jgi:Pre-mRNA-splicing factor of RES complex